MSESTVHTTREYGGHSMKSFEYSTQRRNMRSKQHSWSQLRLPIQAYCVYCTLWGLHSRPPVLQQDRMKRFRKFVRNCSSIHPNVSLSLLDAVLLILTVHNSPTFTGLVTKVFLVKSFIIHYSRWRGLEE